MTSPEPNDAIVKEIEINAPAERVFAALTDPLERVRWWGAEGKFQATQMESDLRPGGAWQMSGVGGGGQPFSISGEYRVVERPRLLEFTWQPNWPEPQSLVRFELNERDGVTMVRLIHSGLSTAETRDRYQGWPWLLVLLQSYIKTESN